MSMPKDGRLPIEATEDLIVVLDEIGETPNAAEDVYTVLWWLADNGWDIVKSKVEP